MHLCSFLLMISIVTASCNIGWHASEEPHVKLRGCTALVELKIKEYEGCVSLLIIAFRDSTGRDLPGSMLKRDLLFHQDSSANAVDSLENVLIATITYPGYEKDCGIYGNVIYEAKVLEDGTLSEPCLKQFPKNSYGLQKEAKRALREHLPYIKLHHPENYYTLEFHFLFIVDEI